ncbi:SAM-dependent methyltransferase [Vibrio furnissii]|uniref:SAM-dependent methyltransferase n=1 Tax=Vibrio furnissii TaxID=29494 RepID=A0A0Q2MBK4_VIBFU|nr:methyltransferase [Vibrio furnissii]KQH85441.1 SAM-dependent methyltransferase [Vibrio furnissii]
MRELFLHLDHFLTHTQPLWRFESFHASAQVCVPWAQAYPLLEQWLHGLDEPTIEQLKNSPSELLASLSPLVDGLAEIWQRIQLPPAPLMDCQTSAIESGIPGRKLEQIRRLGGAVVSLHRGQAWLEWCSGKGYLGRVLASKTRQHVTSFEYQTELCERGQQDADALHLPMRFVQGDAFDEQSRACFSAQQHAVALHACGDLHVRLMQYATDASLQAISFSPCCYHLTQSSNYQCLSQLAQTSSLSLTRQELRIPLQETVTGGERVRRHRFEEMSYRLGFDALLKAELGITAYQPVPSIKKSQLSDGFTAFCHWAAQHKGIALPTVDFAHYQYQGEQRFWEMERLSLVQLGFLRLIEMWLVLDKAMYLQERGYQVEVSEFCERTVTPRNILIHAWQA